jgi:uncharacterized protein (TIGR02246 family)
MSSNPVDVVLQFEQRINSRNPAMIADLLTPDSVFVDSLGSRLQGLDKLRAGWEAYFKIAPDYSISHEEIFSHGDSVALIGSARGTYSPDGRLRKENFWSTPAAWRALVRNEKIALWQVFADNEPLRATMSRTPAKEQSIHSPTTI